MESPPLADELSEEGEKVPSGSGSERAQQDAIEEQRRCEEALFARLRARRPSLIVRQPRPGESVQGTWVDADRLKAGNVAYSFVQTGDGELIRFGVTSEAHKRLRGRQVDVRLLEGNQLSVKSYRTPEEVDAQRNKVRAYLKKIATETDDSRYTFRELSGEGRLGGQISDRPAERVGDREYLRLNKGWDVYLVPATKELKKQRGQWVRLEMERQRNGELAVARVEAAALTKKPNGREKSKGRGFDR